MMLLSTTPPAARRARGARRALVAVVSLALLAPVVVLAGATAAGGSEQTTTKTPVMGPNLLSADQLARWYNHVRGGQKPRLPALDDNIRRLAQIFIEEGRKEGVRGDIAFAQSVLETAWFTFPDYGQIRPWFNNYAGINAYDGRPPGTTCEAETAPSRCFPTPRIGVRTQIHLLRGYADASSARLGDRLRLPPPDRIGAAPYWELFGGQSGTAIWATAPYYGLRVLGIYSDAAVFNGARPECFPFSSQSVRDPSGRGYWLVTQDGRVHPIGSAPRLGDVAGMRLNRPLIGGEARSDGAGYWLLALDGGIFTFGDAQFYGSTGNLRLNQPINGLERTDTNRGYWLVAYDGGIFTFGDAQFYGSTGGMRLNLPVFGMERTRSGRGYWLFALDGGIFTFGDAQFYGSLGDRELGSFVVAMQRTRSGRGYWLMTSAGRVFAFGDARHYGDIRGCGTLGAASRLLVTPSGDGYWIATANGAVIPFGDARRLGMPPTVGGDTVGLMLHR
jgi:hypothetical protein